MGVSRLCNGLRELRLKARLHQRELAQRVGVSRQTLSALESGETVPGTSIALELARVLGCRVEDIFWLTDDETILDAVLANRSGTEDGVSAGTRVATALVEQRWVAHSLDGEGATGLPVPADGTVATVAKRKSAAGVVRIRPLRGQADLRQNLLVAGCDPALGLLGGHLAERFGAGRLHWVEAGSTAALDMLARGEVHLAGLHLFDEDSGDYNVTAVRRRFPGRPMLLLNLAVWELGLVVKAGNPRKIARVSDLARRGVSMIARESGTGSQELLGRVMAEEGVPRKAINFVGTARGHAAVALAVAAGAADAGVATRAAAANQGLEFLPLAEARFDLAMSATAAQDLRLERLRDVLASARFRRDLGGIAGYGASRTGSTVAETAS
jgi:putative molybdopterin biosynthesis protein